MTPNIIEVSLYYLKNELNFSDRSLNIYRDYYIEQLLRGKFEPKLQEWVFYFQEEIFRKTIYWKSEEMQIIEDKLKHHFKLETSDDYLIELFKYYKKPSESISKLYVIYNEDVNIYKIGVSNKVNKRLKALQCASGCELELVMKSKKIKAYALESYFHFIFKKKRTFGEWFKLNDSDLQFIRNYLEKI